MRRIAYSGRARIGRRELQEYEKIPKEVIFRRSTL